MLVVLPIDLLILIFIKLNNIRNVINFALTCKFLYQIYERDTIFNKLCEKYGIKDKQKTWKETFIKWHKVELEFRKAFGKNLEEIKYLFKEILPSAIIR